MSPKLLRDNKHIQIIVVELDTDPPWMRDDNMVVDLLRRAPFGLLLLDTDLALVASIAKASSLLPDTFASLRITGI